MNFKSTGQLAPLHRTTGGPLTSVQYGSTTVDIATGAILSPASAGAPHSLGQRLLELGRTASLELSPAQTHSPKLKYTLVGALDEAAVQGPPGAGARAPLAASSRCFVNMVKKSARHFEEVAAAAAALQQRGMVAVPHLPACRFDTLEQLDDVLSQLSAAGCSQLLLLGGNDQHERGNGGGAVFSSAGELLASGALMRHGFVDLVMAGHPEGHPGLGKDMAATTELLVRPQPHTGAPAFLLHPCQRLPRRGSPRVTESGAAAQTDPKTSRTHTDRRGRRRRPWRPATASPSRPSSVSTPPR